MISIVLKGLLSALSCFVLTSTLIDREQVVGEIEVQRRRRREKGRCLYTHTHPLVAASPALLSPLKVLRDSPSSFARSSQFCFSSLTLALMEMERICYSGQGLLLLSFLFCHSNRSSQRGIKMIAIVIDDHVLIHSVGKSTKMSNFTTLFIEVWREKYYRDFLIYLLELKRQKSGPKESP